ncbi:hypothetical protein [Peribacillus kribbensis]|uniref:hypothetical protein n=1 Tax=Peribacillus kribbensis TaxID=356658 RepID=UPI0012DCB502|nr:hypothetical protein [Peribacillus kribbensis]
MIICDENRRADHFLDDKVPNTQLSMLPEASAIKSILPARNHQCPTAPVMKKLNTRYFFYINRRYQQDGHVFQGRYYAEMLGSMDQFIHEKPPVFPGSAGNYRLCAEPRAETSSAASPFPKYLVENN